MAKLDRHEILRLLASSVEEVELQVETESGRHITIVSEDSSARSAAHNAMLKHSIPFFAHEKLGVMVAEHHHAWSDSICEGLDIASRGDVVMCGVTIVAARNHGKSAWNSYVVPLWLAVTRPGIEIGIIARGDRTTELMQILQKGVRGIPGIENTPALKHLVPEIKTKKWTEDRIELNNGSVIWVRGADSNLRGYHPDVVICDDYMKEACIYSARERFLALSVLQGAIIPMINPGGLLISVGTPMHDEDVFAWIKQRSDWLYDEYPCWREDVATGERAALWPERFSVAQLEGMMRAQGALAFTREYLCQPITSLSSLFPDDILVTSKDRGFRLRMPVPWVYKMCPAIRIVVMDIGIGSEQGSDPTVIMVIGVDDDGHRRLLHIERKVGLGMGGMVDRFVEIGNYYRVDHGILETNQAQAFVGDAAIEAADFSVSRYNTGAEKHKLDIGIPSLLRLFERSLYKFPRGDEESIRLTNIIYRELQSHTIDNGRVVDVGSHNDTVMCLWLAEQLLRKVGFGDVMSFDLQEGDEAVVEDYWGEIDDEDYLEDEDDSILSQEIREQFGFNDRTYRVSQGLAIPTPADILTRNLWQQGGAIL